MSGYYILTGGIVLAAGIITLLDWVANASASAASARTKASALSRQGPANRSFALHHNYFVALGTRDVRSSSQLSVRFSSRVGVALAD